LVSEDATASADKRVHSRAFLLKDKRETAVPKGGSRREEG